MPNPTTAELEDWLSLLGIHSAAGYARCESDEERIAVCENLLHFKWKDKMSKEDELFIIAALDLLRKREGEVGNESQVVQVA